MFYRYAIFREPTDKRMFMLAATLNTVCSIDILYLESQKTRECLC